MQWWADGFDLLLTPTLGEPPPELGVFNTPDEPFLGFMRAATFMPYTPRREHDRAARDLAADRAGARTACRSASQLVARYGREDLLLQVAAQLEPRAPWADRRPAVHA